MINVVGLPLAIGIPAVVDENCCSISFLIDSQ